MLAIETVELTKVFGNFVAVNGINLRVKAGENFGLLGPNGAGKTTTIRMIAGLIKPTKGEVRVFGIDVTRERREALKVIGYMPQKFSLYEDLTVEENVLLYARLFGLSRAEAKERAKELLKRFLLWEFRNRLAGKLSGGMKQRLALSVSLVHDPKLLMLDEPTAGVDPPLRRKFWEFFRELNKEGKTILITTHYMDEAENCDRLALMSRGRIIAEGTPREIKRKAIGGDLVEIIAEGHVRLKADWVKSLEKRDGRFFALVDDAAVRIPQIIKELEGQGIRVISVAPVFVSLEEAFIRFLGG